jgi:hypothetical protein
MLELLDGNDAILRKSRGFLHRMLASETPYHEKDLHFICIGELAPPHGVIQEGCQLLIGNSYANLVREDAVMRGMSDPFLKDRRRDRDIATAVQEAD